LLKVSQSSGPGKALGVQSEGSDHTGQSGRHARNISALAVAEVAGKAASFVMFAVAARTLGASEFGQFSWSLNLALLLSVVVSWGFDLALIQLASVAPGRLNTLLSNTLAIRAALAPLVLLAVLVFPAGPGQNLAVTELLTLMVLADSANQAIRAAASVLQRQREIAVNLVIQRFLTAALSIAVLVLGGGVTAFATAYFGGTLLGMCALFWTGHRIGLTPSVRLVSRPVMRELVTHSTALGINSVLNLLIFRADVLLLGWMLDSTAVGIYAVAYKLFEALLFVLWSIDRVALPAMTSAKGDAAVRRGLHRACTVAFAAFLPYMMIMLLRGGEILKVTFGSPYDVDSLVTLQILAVALLPYGVQYILALGLYARRGNTRVTVSASVGLAVNVVANLLLIPRLGPAGAAWATLLAFTVQSILLWVFVNRTVGGPAVLRAALVPGIAAVAMVPALLAPIGLVVALLLASLAYGGTWWLMAGRWDREARAALIAMVGRAG
jgi:O-antigen/teichoic acid export membrane protein